MVCGKEVPANLKPDRKTQLDDVMSAFYFSRLPREERIARILFAVLAPGPKTDGYIVKFTGPLDLLEIGKELAKYSVKDFAIRPGKLDG